MPLVDTTFNGGAFDRELTLYSIAGRTDDIAKALYADDFHRLHRSLSKGGGWLQEYNELLEKARRAAGAIMRMMNRPLSLAWERYQHWYYELMEQKRRLEGAVRRMLNRNLSMAWEQWQVSMHAHHHTRVCCITPTLTNPDDLLTTSPLLVLVPAGQKPSLQSLWSHPTNAHEEAVDGLGAVATVVRRDKGSTRET